MALGVTSDTEGFAAGWDWKGEYVDRLSGGDGLERFSQGSLTPDTTLLFAGPARFSTVAADTSRLHPIGLVDSFAYSSNSPVQPLYEIGSNRTFFTRGKTQNQIQLSSMLADSQNLMRAVMEEVYDGTNRFATDGDYFVNTRGTKAPGAENSDLWLNLDSEALSLPFGILMVFKTKGQEDGNDLYGKIIGAAYLELCMMTNFNLNVQAQAPTIQENVGIMFDRAVPVAVG